MAEESKRQAYQRRWNSLEQERSSWITHWRELSEYLLPRNGRFVTTDRNRGDKRDNKIYNSVGTQALDVLVAGLMSGMTSPARPWFRLAPSDYDLVENENVRLWLERVARIMREIFARSNTYRALPMVYEELGGFGTGATLIEPNYESVIHHYPMTIGEYAIATNEYGVCDTIYRQFEMTTSQMIAKFGKENVSRHVLNLHDMSKSKDAWIKVTHAIQPREKYDSRKKDAINMPFSSCYYETFGEEDKLLLESGYKSFRALVPRWKVQGGDIYGNSPGMRMLGDVKQLQHQEFRKAQAIDYMTLPPVQVPTAAKGADIDTLPGGVSYIDSIGAGGGMRSAFDVRLDLSHMREDISKTEARIREACYADLFMMLTLQEAGREMTAREVAERHEEKLLMLGPVLERLHNEMLKPLIDITFEMALEAGILPPPPDELAGQDLNVEFISVLAQAQRAAGIGAIDRYMMTLGTLAPLKPEVMDKLDADQLADEVADMLGVDPKLVVSDDKVALIRKDRAKVQAAAAQAANAQAMAAAAKDAAAAKTSEPSVLTDAVSGQFSGYSQPPNGGGLPKPPGL